MGWLSIGIKVLPYIVEAVQWVEKFIMARGKPKQDAAVEMIKKITHLDLENVILWHPKTDYLGNHMLTSWKFRNVSGWSPKIDLETGIRMSFDSIMKSEGYNPLKYLEEAKNSSEENKLDLYLEMLKMKDLLET